MPDNKVQLRAPCRVAVIWIDWYPYHVARLRGLQTAPSLAGGVVGLELVGGVGVHQGLKFREDLPVDLPVETLMPGASWREAGKVTLARKLWSRLTKLQPEVVLVPGYYTLPALAAAAWARLHGRTSVLMTESTAGDHPRPWWKELPKRLALAGLFDWAVTGGSAHVAYLRQLGFPADRIVGCYDVVDNRMFADGTRAIRADEEFATGRRPAGWPPVDMPGKNFLYVGRLAEEKNVMGLLRAWASYRQEGGSWPLVLCGDGPERGALENAAAALPCGHEVQFTGLKTSRDLLPIYAHAGCFVLPSTREPWGLVVNEAMSAGLPVLVSDRCGCSVDLVEPGENGFRFDPRDQAGLTRLLHTLEQMTPEERTRLGQRSAERIASFSPERFGEAIATVAARRANTTQPKELAEVTS